MHIAYGHTSHGSQLITGMNGLVPFFHATLGKGLIGRIISIAWNNGGTEGTPWICMITAMDGDVGYYPEWVNNTRGYLGEAEFR